MKIYEQKMVVELITPTKAAELLESMPSIQRDERKQAAKRYEYTMESGLWRDDYSAPIVISDEGKMLDGQHRCLACMRTGKPFWSWVNYGVPESAYPAIDSNVPRNVADFLDCHNKKNVAAIGNAMFELIMSDSMNPLNGARTHGATRHWNIIPTSERVKFCYLNIERLVDRASLAKTKAAAVDNAVTATQLGILLSICEAVDSKKAREWIDQLTRYSPVIVDIKAARDKNDGRNRALRRSPDEMMKEANARMLLDFDDFMRGKSTTFNAKSRERIERAYSGLDYSDWMLPEQFDKGKKATA